MPAIFHFANRRARPLLLGVVLLFLLLMLSRHIDEPLLDRHSWRQVDTAGFARGLARGEFDLFHPKFLAYYPDAYGLDGATESEFNLYPLLVAGLYRLLGEREALARLVTIAFSLGTAIWVYLLGRRLLDEAAALLAVLFLGLSPLYVFYGRTVQPDAVALFFSSGAFYLFLRWLDDNTWPSYVGAALCAALAFLVKIPSLYLGVPLLGAAFHARGRHLWRDRRLWLLAALALVPTVAYYLYAHNLYLQTGMTVYGISGGWPGSGKFEAADQLLSLDFYRVMFGRLRGVILGRYGFPAFVLGLLIAPSKREEWLLMLWLGSTTLFILAVAQGNRQHEYYQLPLVPVAALYIGKALSRLLQRGMIRIKVLGLGERLGLLLVAVLLLASLRNAQSHLAPMYAQTPLLLDVARAARELTPAGRPIAVLYDWARVPEVFYYADRRGWALWLERTPAGEYDRLIVAERERTPSGWKIEEKLERGIERFELLRSLGGASLVVSLEKGTAAEFLRSPIGRALTERYPLRGSAEHWLVYELR